MYLKFLGYVIHYWEARKFILSDIHVTVARIEVPVKVEGENAHQSLLSKEGGLTVAGKALVKNGEF